MGLSIYPTPAASSGYPTGTTAERPVNPTKGSLYYDTTLGGVLIYNGSSWSTFIRPPALEPPYVVTAANAANRPYGNGGVLVTFSDPIDQAGEPATYTVASNSGGYTATGTSSPILVTGMAAGGNYTFNITSNNGYHTSGYSPWSNSVTVSTVPQAPTVGAVSNYLTAGGGAVSVAFTANDAGGSSITSYTVTSSPGNITATGTSSPIIVTGLTNGTAYTFTVTATNANGASAASSASASVTPTAPPPVTGGTVTSDATYYYREFQSSDNFVIWQSSLTFDYILVGGGAAGNGGNQSTSYNGGGGGGVVYGTALAKTTGTYPVVIGGGGGGCAGGGGQSTALGFTANGGNGGGGYSGGGGYTWLNGVTYGQNGNSQSQVGGVGHGGSGPAGSGRGGNGAWYNCDGGAGASGNFIIRYTRAQVGG